MNNEIKMLNETLMESLINFLSVRDIKDFKTLNENTNFIKEFGIDSLDLVELFVLFEDDLGIIFPDDIQDINIINNINSVSKYIINNNLMESN